MLKTISHNEYVNFLTIMQSYYTHLLAYPHTLVARILGLHKIKMVRDGKTERIYFVIMANVFNTTRKIQVKYDLKGSTQGRTSIIDGKMPKPEIALKDCDWLA
jgi:1-phosphatidylinositol-4-phosphate 5-kinase